MIDDLYILLGNGKILTAYDKILVSRRQFYGEWELDDMIANQGFIPVATASELNAFRNAVSQTMGAGTKWEGTYTTGLDKKYIQVLDIDYGGGIAPIKPFQGTYDGNNLNIIGITDFSNVAETGLFSGHNPNPAILRNIRLKADLNTTNQYASLLFGRNYSPSTLIENCHVEGTCRGNNNTGMICGDTIGGTFINCRAVSTNLRGRERTGGILGSCSTTPGVIDNCIVKATISASSNNPGGILGLGTANISDCIFIGTIYTPQSNAGGIVGFMLSTGSINRCFTKGSVEVGALTAGGIAGRCDGAISNSYAHCFIKGSDRVGGIVGQNGNVTNSYCVGLINSAGSAKGGLGGINTAVVTNSYYDSDVATIIAGKGSARTTLQMKQGTKDSFIMPAGGIDATEDPANAMYTSWDTDIWDFLTTADYPVLK